MNETQISKTPEPITTGELVAPLADSMPPVTNPGEPGAGANPNPEPKSSPEPVSTPAAQSMGKDSLGREFDPNKFRAEKDILGRWKNLRSGPGRAKGVPNAKPVGPKPPAPNEPGASVIPPDEPTPQPPVADRYALAAEAYLFAGYSLLDGAMAGQGEWMPDNPAEHEAMKGALTAWLRSRQSEDLPPGAAFALAAVGYGAKRFQRPNTQTRWRVYWLYLRAWWGNRAARAKLADLQESAAALAAQKAEAEQ